MNPDPELAPPQRRPTALRAVPATGPERYNRFAGRIAAARRRAGQSRADLGAQVGVPAATIALWEDESYEGVDLSILERVAAGTGLRLEIGFAMRREERRSQAVHAEAGTLERSA